MKLPLLYDEKSNEYEHTCSCDIIIDGAVGYALSREVLGKFVDSGKKVAVLIPYENSFAGGKINGTTIIHVKNPLLDFVLFHNYINKERLHRYDDIRSLEISNFASIGNAGMKYIQFEDRLVNMKHMGSVIIKEGVEIGPFSSVARATLDYTIIEEDCRIGCGVHIGHNCRVGKRTIIIDGAVIGGSAVIGDRCWIGLDATVRDGVKICDNVFVGMSSAVVKDITEPGTYIGVPAKRIGDWDGTW